MGAIGGVGGYPPSYDVSMGGASVPLPPAVTAALGQAQDLSNTLGNWLINPPQPYPFATPLQPGQLASSLDPIIDAVNTALSGLPTTSPAYAQVQGLATALQNLNQMSATPPAISYAILAFVSYPIGAITGSGTGAGGVSPYAPVPPGTLIPSSLNADIATSYTCVQQLLQLCTQTPPAVFNDTNPAYENASRALMNALAGAVTSPAGASSPVIQQLLYTANALFTCPGMVGNSALATLAMNTLGMPLANILNLPPP